MKATGIVRRIDHLGRIVLPKELRAQLEITEGTPLEMYMDGNMIVLAKYVKGCLFCGAVEGLVEHRGKLVCKNCITEITRLGVLEQAGEALSDRDRDVVSDLRRPLTRPAGHAGTILLGTSGLRRDGQG